MNKIEVVTVLNDSNVKITAPSIFITHASARRYIRNVILSDKFSIHEVNVLSHQKNKINLHEFVNEGSISYE
jgi:hypothetical protein